MRITTTKPGAEEGWLLLSGRGAGKVSCGCGMSAVVVAVLCGWGGGEGSSWFQAGREWLKGVCKCQKMFLDHFLYLEFI